MKTRISFTVLLSLLVTIPFTAQEFACGHEKVTNLQKENRRDFDRHFLKVQQAVKEYIELKNNAGSGGRQSAPTPTTYYIPVVFHVVHPSGQAYGTGANISYNQIISQVNALNAAFSKNYPSYNGQGHASFAQNVDIQFCLAKTPMPSSASFYAGPQGTEYGVMRYGNTSVSNHHISNASANALLSLTHPTSSHFPFGSYLNIWVVSSIGSGPGTTMGYAPTPLMSAFPLDGVVMRSDVVGDNTTGGTFALGYGLDQGKILVHEVGHYLNLYHIFQGGCSGLNASGSPTDACDLNGDFVCDTDPCTTQNFNCSLPVPNTCVSNYTTGTTQSDMIENYMSYADDNCMNTFTYDQAQRMWATLNLMRFNLWQTANLSATGVIGPGGCISSFLISGIQKSTNNHCAGNTVILSNVTAGNSATSRSWTLSGGSPALASGASVTVTYPTPGNFWAKLAVSDGTNTITDSVPIQVTNCALDSTKLDRSHWFFGNYAEINFSTNPPSPGLNAITYSTLTNGFESTVSMCDKKGNHLFYTNSIDMWDNNHQQVNNSTVFETWSSTPGVISVPYPGDTTRYIVVTSPHSGGSYDSIYYVVYNKISHTVTHKRGFIHDSLPSSFGEPLTIVPHCNGQDYWLLCRPNYTLSNWDRAYAILLTPAGPANINTVTVSYGLQWGVSGQWKSNHAGTRLVHALFGGPHPGVLQDFDKVTGRITNPVPIGQMDPLTPTGAIFSPNDSIVYIMRSWGANYINIVMFNVNSMATQTLLSHMLAYKGLQFEMGPDNNIYCSQGDFLNTTIARINNPNSWANAAYVPGVIAFTGNVNPFGGMCNFPDAEKGPEIGVDFHPVSVNCNTKRFDVDSCWQAYTASWQFGDGSSGTGLSATHTYTSPGAYSVILTLSVGNYSLAPITRNVVVLSQTLSIAGPSVICTGDPFPAVFSTGSVSGATYSWSVQNGAISGPSIISYADVFAASQGIVTVAVTVNDNGCLSSGTRTVLADDVQVSLPDLAKHACIDETVLLNGSPAGGSYSGNHVSGNQFSAPIPGTYTVQYTYTNGNGCTGATAGTIAVSECTGLDPSSATNGVRVYPNPAHGQFILQANLTIPYILQVYNALGECLITETVKEKKHLLDIREYSGGIYFCRISAGNRSEHFSIVNLK